MIFFSVIAGTVEPFFLEIKVLFPGPDKSPSIIALPSLFERIAWITNIFFEKSFKIIFDTPQEKKNWFVAIKKAQKHLLKLQGRSPMATQSVRFFCFFIIEQFSENYHWFFEEFI